MRREPQLDASHLCLGTCMPSLVPVMPGYVVFVAPFKACVFLRLVRFMGTARSWGYLGGSGGSEAELGCLGWTNGWNQIILTRSVVLDKSQLL